MSQALNTDSVITRETAWLNITTDTLPALVGTGAPFAVISAQFPRQKGNLPAVRVTRSEFRTIPYATQQTFTRHAMRLRVWWPVLGSGDAAAAATALDAALELLLQRVVGPVDEKKHGGRFMSVAEEKTGQPGVIVKITDPEVALAHGKALTADVLYVIDDLPVPL